MPDSIHPATHIGTVALTVTDLDRSLDFYQRLIGLRLHRRDDNTAYLGVGSADLLIVQQQPHARRYRGVCGLYHFALLAPDRHELARAGSPLPRTLPQLNDSYLKDAEGAEAHRLSNAKAQRARRTRSILNAKTQRARRTRRF